MIITIDWFDLICLVVLGVFVFVIALYVFVNWLIYYIKERRK